MNELKKWTKMCTCKKNGKLVINRNGIQAKQIYDLIFCEYLNVNSLKYIPVHEELNGIAK